MRFSDFGTRFGGARSGIGALMRDLAPDGPPPACPLGGGNPARIAALERAFADALARLAADPDTLGATLGAYASPRGHAGFLDALVDALNARHDWSLTRANVCLTDGSQSAFFELFNLLGGAREGGFARVLLPMTPEYIGYGDVGIGESPFVARRPRIERLDGKRFKYHVDLAALPAPDEPIGAIAVSRPTNPTGNVLDDAEMDALDARARAADVPLVVDAAYGAPFPGIVHRPITTRWHRGIVLSLSLSKLGLPGARTGIVVADEAIVEALAEMNAVMHLAPASLVPAMMTPLLASGELFRLCEEHLLPFYRERSARALEWFDELFEDLPVRAHRHEGAIFLWLWFEGVPLDDTALYARLREQGVVVVPGHHFFPGLAPGEDWPHRHQCLRVSIAGTEPALREGLERIAAVARAALEGERRA